MGGIKGGLTVPKKPQVIKLTLVQNFYKEAMSEQQLDFKKIVAAFKSDKYTPEQIGSFMRQYYKKHLADLPVTQADSYTQTLDDVSMFDGKLPLFNR